MFIVYYFLQFVISFFASMLFSILFNAPRRLLLACGFVGAMGWIIYKLSFDADLGKVLASFLGSFILAIMSHVMSRRYKRPVIIFIVPGIIPLVPGGLAYEATRFLVSNQYTHAVNTFLEVTLISGAIAFGILCAEIIYYIYTRVKQHYGKMKGKTYKKSYNINNRA
ncbi:MULTISPECIES: threonine/serine exporter family protein [Staphylococcus]|uniref:Integral membrane protein n=2 Tax=Staphylococcus saprophyticus TaxID=29385 RepID=A0A380HMZ0_STASA|nr:MULTISPECIES: threonine/serine exporter family protein [Staphylococcus]QDX06408.1 threonine/serine exporter family protein [Staphylococcus saprophyticus]RXS04307.1 threonine/serine exporter family protein [Staphylococcus saprophyticus]RXS09164.1 threonine/serine exporter family protein [Staphylococcus saprophyticus]RXS20427.1 threonine/serine exporter family protein [Staphylococcus saprophyticus]RXS22870.1 threonine/serine exporter family protein [Staphylococcus saprophyticus]